MMPMALIGGVAQAVVGASAAQQQANAQAALANYQAQVAINNEKISEQNAEFAYKVGESQAQQKGIQHGQERGAIIAAQAASGLDVGSGGAAGGGRVLGSSSAVDVQASQEELSMLDLQTVRNNAAWQAYGQRVNATNFAAQASLDEYAAQLDKQAGQIGAMASLVGGFSGFASNTFRIGMAGGFGNLEGFGTL